MQQSRLALSLCAFLTLVAGLVDAGELTPPGAPQPTTFIAESRTPITAIPVTIEESGSYFLTGNLTMIGDGHGIVVAADNVTIDLNGFALIGDPLAASGIGITSNPLVLLPESLTVVNGGVRHWVGGGIDFDQYVGSSRIENIHVSECGGDGIYLGNNAIVRNCTVEGCLGTMGIGVNTNSTIENCVAHDNAGYGIRTEDASAVRGCVSRDNGDYGFVGQGSFTDCSASDNSTAGFLLGPGTVISGCSSEGNGIGISGNSELTVVDCNVSTSGTIGIDAGNRSTVSNCTVAIASIFSSADGIVVEDDCLVVGNLVRGHVNGAGIVVQGDQNRIEGNSVVSAVTGLDVIGSNNLAIRNSFTDVTTAIGVPLNPNTFGPIITSATIGANSNPHANYQH